MAPPNPYFLCMDQFDMEEKSVASTLRRVAEQLLSLANQGQCNSLSLCF